MADQLDAIVIGGGPNGLAAAIRLMQAGWRVRLYEANATIGGSSRTEELTLDGFKHDVGSAIHPLGIASPYLSTLPLDQFGLEWIHPDIPVAHPLDGGIAGAQFQSIEETAAHLGEDGDAWKNLMSPWVKNWDTIANQFLGPLQIPSDPILMTRFGLNAIQPTNLLAALRFKTDKAKALFAGLAAHSILRMETLASAAFGLVLGALGHKVGWPFPKGGAQSITDAMASYFESLGGEIVLNHPVTSMNDLPPAKAYVFNVTPRQLLTIAGDEFTSGYASRLQKYRYGPSVFKIDYAVSEPIPWTAHEPRRAGTVHIGGTLKEIAISERAPHQGKHPERPYILLAQHSLFDDTRAPEDKHTVWAYCHVPHGSDKDMSDSITNQIERFAPGFRDTILASHTMNSSQFESWNANIVGGDISGGSTDLFQIFTRPSVKWRPYRTSADNIYICSSSTPPGAGVHGMGGYWAAETILKDHS